MTPAGWIIMTLSIGTVVTLASYCLYRVLTLPPVELEESIKGIPDIDTHDLQDTD